LKNTLAVTAGLLRTLIYAQFSEIKKSYWKK